MHRMHMRRVWGADLVECGLRWGQGRPGLKAHAHTHTPKTKTEFSGGGRLPVSQHTGNQNASRRLDARWHD
eukprot:1873499-Pleurochrysis_carterae.AAC.3